ncbi:hypothetical protein RHSIM_Rhsim08G0004600 [Rhododendron simsii]|uniref:Uncharacterized protein n=1 Tax=Rhododendron simsii TaxID=118357 RepID=A0A834LFJ2_RHOSS|nr:hypothetical protein RHSIM_Rhsim08G0004600 [Rhododendron simsii]
MRSNSLGHTEVYKGFDCQVVVGGDRDEGVEVLVGELVLQSEAAAVEEGAGEVGGEGREGGAAVAVDDDHMMNQAHSVYDYKKPIPHLHWFYVLAKEVEPNPNRQQRKSDHPRSPRLSKAVLAMRKKFEDDESVASAPDDSVDYFFRCPRVRKRKSDMVKHKCKGKSRDTIEESGLVTKSSRSSTKKRKIIQTSESRSTKCTQTAKGQGVPRKPKNQDDERPEAEKGNARVLKRTPFWFLFDALRKNKLPTNKCRKDDAFVSDIIKTYVPGEHGFKIGRKFVRLTRNDYWLCKHTKVVRSVETEAFPRILKWNIPDMHKVFKKTSIRSLSHNQVKVGNLIMTRKERIYDGDVEAVEQIMETENEEVETMETGDEEGDTENEEGGTEDEGDTENEKGKSMGNQSQEHVVIESYTCGNSGTDESDDELRGTNGQKESIRDTYLFIVMQQSKKRWRKGTAEGSPMKLFKMLDVCHSQNMKKEGHREVEPIEMAHENDWRTLENHRLLGEVSKLKGTIEQMQGQIIEMATSDKQVKADHLKAIDVKDIEITLLREHITLLMKEEALLIDIVDDIEVQKVTQQHRSEPPKDGALPSKVEATQSKRKMPHRKPRKSSVCHRRKTNGMNRTCGNSGTDESDDELRGTNGQKESIHDMLAGVSNSPCNSDGKTYRCPNQIPFIVMQQSKMQIAMEERYSRRKSNEIIQDVGCMPFTEHEKEGHREVEPIEMAHENDWRTLENLLLLGEVSKLKGTIEQMQGQIIEMATSDKQVKADHLKAIDVKDMEITLLREHITLLMKEKALLIDILDDIEVQKVTQQHRSEPPEDEALPSKGEAAQSKRKMPLSKGKEAPSRRKMPRSKKATSSEGPISKAQEVLSMLPKEDQLKISQLWKTGSTSELINASFNMHLKQDLVAAKNPGDPLDRMLDNWIKKTRSFRLDCGVIVIYIMQRVPWDKEIESNLPNDECKKIRVEILHEFLSDEELYSWTQKANKE